MALRNGWVQIAIGAAVSIFSVVLLFYAIAWQDVLRILERTNLALVAVAVLLLVASLTAKTVRWRFLLPSSADVTTARLFRILHISMLLNNILPARMGDIARVSLTARQPGLRVGHVLSSLVTERFADAVMLTIAAAIVLPFVQVPDRWDAWVQRVSYGAPPLLIALGIGGFAAYRIARRRKLAPATRISSWISGEWGAFREGLRSVVSRERAPKIWFWSAVAWIAAFAINFVLLRAMHIHVPIAVAVFLTCATNLAMLIPSSPGYIGVFHAVTTLCLLPFGVTPNAALGFAILSHLVNVLPVCLIGIIVLMSGRELRYAIPAIRRRQTAPVAEDPPSPLP